MNSNHHNYTKNDGYGVPALEIDPSVKIKIQDAYKIYKRGKIEVVALRGLNCEFHRGELTVIMGPSGCGKTTLLNVIGGLDRLNSGMIHIDGQNLAQFTDRQIENFRREKLGFVFQFSSLIPELTAEENVMLPIDLAGKLTAEKRKYIAELLDIVELTDRKTHRPDELSGGEQQRIGVAAALANNPDIILCDEPTGELDSVTKVLIMDLLRKIIDTYPEKTMVVVSHDPELRRIADRMYYIRDGRISHQFSKVELDAMNGKADGTGAFATGHKTSEKSINDALLIELREIDHMIKEKIEKIEKQIHPV